MTSVKYCCCCIAPCSMHKLLAFIVHSIKKKSKLYKCIKFGARIYLTFCLGTKFSSNCPLIIKLVVQFSVYDHQVFYTLV